MRQFLTVTVAITLAAAISQSSSAQQQPSDSTEILKKWGVAPAKAGGEAIEDSNRRQPMTGSYPYWMAVKFIPGFLDDKTLLPYVEKEIEYSRNYQDHAGKQKPWLSHNEVKGRHARMAAPEFLGRYKTHIRSFTERLSTRVSSGNRIGHPRYNQSTGMMHFLSRQDKNDEPIRTNLAQHHEAQDYLRLANIYGSAGLDEIAKQTVGRKLGLIVTINGSQEKVRLNPGLRVPMALQVGRKRFPMIWIAADRELHIKGIRMSQRDAEQFLIKYEDINFRAQINYTIKGAFDYYHQTASYKGSAAVFLADVEDATIYAYVRQDGVDSRKFERKVFARYKSSNFPSPTVTVATLKAQHDAESARKTADAQAQQEQSRQSEQQLHEDIASLKQSCAASESADETAECYDELCAKIKKTRDRKEMQWCANEHRRAYSERRSAQAAANNASQAAKMEEQRQGMAIDMSCKRKYTGYVVQPWMPAQDTPEFQNAMTACRNEPERSVYGPDILGLRLGMPLNVASNLIRHQSVNQNTTLKDTRPFEKAALYWSDDANHGIAVFSLVNGEHERVAAVSRRLFMGEKKVTADQVVKGLRKKYGQELWSNGSDTMLWAFPEGAQKASAKVCSGLVSQIEARAGWNKVWAASPDRKTAREQRATQRAAGMNAYSECVSKFSMASGTSTGSPPSAVQMQELQNCIREKGLTSSGTSSGAAQSTGGDNARLPMMIASNGNPKLYEEYKACGPVVITHANTDGTGTLTDIYQVLFDPDWISHQPAFAFKSGKGKSEIQF